MDWAFDGDRENFVMMIMTDDSSEENIFWT